MPSAWTTAPSSKAPGCEEWWLSCFIRAGGLEGDGGDDGNGAEKGIRVAVLPEPMAQMQTVSLLFLVASGYLVLGTAFPLRGRPPASTGPPGACACAPAGAGRKAPGRRRPRRLRRGWLLRRTGARAVKHGSRGRRARRPRRKPLPASRPSPEAPQNLLLQLHLPRRHVDDVEGRSLSLPAADGHIPVFEAGDGHDLAARGAVPEQEL